jgi:hypothetical protein
LPERPKEACFPSEGEKPSGNVRPESSFPDLEELQREVERRIRDNRRFLERFMDDDFVDDGEPEEEDETFEEL